MHTFLDNFHQGWKNSAQIDRYLNIDSSSGCGRNSEGENIVHTKCNFGGGANHSAEIISKVSAKESKKLVRLVIWTTDQQNLCLGTLLDKNMKTTKLQNVQSQQKRLRNGESKYVLMKKLIAHETMAKQIVTKIFMYLWHICMIMKIFLVEVLVTVCN